MKGRIPYKFCSVIIVAIDAQIVLSCLLLNTITTKTCFLRTELTTLEKSKTEIVTWLFIRILFEYVLTDDNPTDMITRGISIRKFKTNFHFRVNSEKWLSIQPKDWPANELNCLNPQNKNVIKSAVFFGSLSEEVEPVVKSFKNILLSINCCE